MARSRCRSSRSRNCEGRMWAKASILRMDEPSHVHSPSLTHAHARAEYQTSGCVPGAHAPAGFDELAGAGTLSVLAAYPPTPPNITATTNASSIHTNRMETRLSSRAMLISISPCREWFCPLIGSYRRGGFHGSFPRSARVHLATAMTVLADAELVERAKAGDRSA